MNIDRFYIILLIAFLAALSYEQYKVIDKLFIIQMNFNTMEKYLLDRGLCQK